MKNPTKYNITWICPKCGNLHNWWWEDEHEAHDDGEIIMTCDRCDTQTWCKGNGNGRYDPVGKVVVDLDKSDVLEQRVDELESLEEDLHNYVRGLEDKVNKLTSNLQKEVYNLGRRTTETELSVWRLENDVKVPESAKLGPQHVELAKKKEKSFLDLINGEKPPFHERIREGCQLDDVEGDKLASILRFIAVEVESMLDRSSGGSYTINNFQVGKKLRVLADEAEIDNSLSSNDEEDEKSPGWDLYGWEGGE
jgi:hypothetical protein